MIYRPEHRLPTQLQRLHERGLSGKRGLALRKLPLGPERFRRFVAGEQLRRAHESLVAVLALQSAPIDPRL